MTFWLFYYIFILGFILSVILPGLILTKKAKIDPPSTKFFIAVITGLVVWTAQGYVFGYLNIRFASYLYILVMLFQVFRNLPYISSVITDTAKELKNIDRKVLTLIIIGTIIQIIPVVGSGLTGKDGITFIGVNGYDGVMHLGYIQSIINSFPPMEPGAAGNFITNYHYWSDLFFAELIRVWHLPIINTFFQFAPPLISLLTAVAMYKLIKVLTPNKLIHLSALFFLYFGSDITYIFMLILHRTFGFYTPAIDNGTSQLLNMPHALAKMIFLAALLLFQYWVKYKQKTVGFITFFLLGSLTGFKVYFAIFSIIGIGSLILYNFFSNWFSANRKKLEYLKNAKNVFTGMFPLFLFSIVFITVFLVIYIPPNKNAGGLFYSPFEWSKMLLGATNIDFKAWWHLYNKFTGEKNVLGVSFLNFVAIIITLLAIHGTRVIGFFISKKTYQILGGENISFLFPGLIIFHLLGFLTLQQSGGLNVFNFFAVSATILAILAAFKLVEMYRPDSFISKITILLIIILTIPRITYDIYFYSYGYIKKGSYYTVTNNELKALNYIKNNTPYNAVVQSHPSNPIDKRVPYVAFFSNRSAYLSGVELQLTHNQPIRGRIEDLNTLINKPNSYDFNKYLWQKGIDLIYLNKHDQQQKFLFFEPTAGHFDTIYENDDIIILHPKKDI